MCQEQRGLATEDAYCTSAYCGYDTWAMQYCGLRVLIPANMVNQAVAAAPPKGPPIGIQPLIVSFLLAGVHTTGAFTVKVSTMAEGGATGLVLHHLHLVCMWFCSGADQAMAASL